MKIQVEEKQVAEIKNKVSAATRQCSWEPLHPFGVVAPIFNNVFLWGHVDEAIRAEWEMIEHMVNAFFFASGSHHGGQPVVVGCQRQ